MKTEILAEVTRGAIVESIHRGAVAVMDKDGKVIASVGDIGYLTYIRSAAKPMQALPVVASGAAKHFSLEPAELALIMASHSGEAEHVSLGMRILEKIGLGAASLQCGTHQPLHEGSSKALLANGQRPTVFHCSCSGKHAGMLTLAQHFQLNTADYFLPGHPVQQMMLESMADFTGLKTQDIPLGVDGCGVPVFALTLERMAYAYARWAAPDAFSAEKRAASHILREAMTGFPTIIAGTGRLATDLMKVTGSKLLVKDGTEGIFCIGIPHKGWGIALKIEDGNLRAGGPIIIRVLKELGILTADELGQLSGFTVKKLKNYRGETVGEIRPAFSLK